MKTRHLMTMVALAAIAGCSGGGTAGSMIPSGSSPSQLTQPGVHPADSTGVLQDGGFEDGYTYWSQCGSGASASEQTSVVHSGTHAAKFGGTTTVPNGEAALCQSFTIPDNAGTVTLWIDESTNQSSTSNDWQMGELASASGTDRKTLFKEAHTTSGWEQRTYDVSTFHGQTVVLKFLVHGNGASGANMVMYVDDITIGGTDNTPSPSPSPTGTPAGDPCQQTKASGQSSSVSIVPYTTVMDAISAAHSVCFSAYVFTSASFDALDAAAKAGAKVTVVLPNEESGLDTTDANALAADGATIVWDPGTSPTHPLHAKLAIVDGVAYLDGRNWDTTDVTITDGVSADFTAIENALNLNPTSSTNLDTLKSNSVTREANYISGGSYSSHPTLRYMTESFGTDTDMNTALGNAALAGANVEIIVLKSDESGNSTEQAALDALKADGAQVRLNPAGGSEKIALISNASTGWFGSANSTKFSTNGTNYIDWGMTVTNSSVLSSLQSYYDTTWASSTVY